MSFFIKYIIKNMFEKKGRFLLLLFSVTISTSLLIISLGLVDVIIDSYRSSNEQIYEDKDVYISSNTDSIFFGKEDFNAIGLSNLEGEISIVSILNEDKEISYVNMRGKQDYSGILIEGDFINNAEAFCIISERISKERNLNVGDKINIAINGDKIEFIIRGISANEGIFYGDQINQFTIVVPYKFLSEHFNTDGLYNYMTAQISDGDHEKVIESFNEKNNNVIATKLYDEASVLVQNSSISTALYIMLCIVCVMSYIIINGAFKLIIIERMPVIGTFMSQGVTYRKIKSILLLESGLYGILGAVLGIIIGESALAVLSYYSSPLLQYGIYEPYEVNVTYIISGVVFAMILSSLSAILPILGIRKIQVKDVILNKVEHKNEKGMIVFGIGLLLFTTGMTGFISNADWAIDLSVFTTLFVFVGAIMITPKIVKFITGKLANLLRKKTTLFLALNSIRTSKLLISNILMLIITFVAVLMIVSTGRSMVNVVVEAYENLSYDCGIVNIINSNLEKSTTDNIIEKLNNLDVVNKDTINPFTTLTCKVDNMSATVFGVEPQEYAEYNQYLELKSEQNKEMYDVFEKSESQVVIITEVLAERINKKMGDTIVVEINGKKDPFEIVGIIDGKLLNGSSFVIINQKYMKTIYNIKEVNCITLEVNGKWEDAENGIQAVLYDFGASYATRDESMKVNIESNNTIVYLLSAFSYVAMFIASIGIFNNISICFQQRKKDLAIMASIGMNGKKRKHLMLAESIICTIYSIIISIPLTMILVNLASKVMKSTGLPILIELDYNAIPTFCIIELLVIYIASLSAMKKGKKLNIVEELKYE